MGFASSCTLEHAHVSYLPCHAACQGLQLQKLQMKLAVLEHQQTSLDAWNGLPDTLTCIGLY